MSTKTDWFPNMVCNLVKKRKTTIFKTDIHQMSSPTKETFFCTEVLKVNGFYQFVIKIKILPTTLTLFRDYIN